MHSGNMKTKIVRLSNLHKAFQKREILRGADLELEAGRFYALIGRNGTGKSTLLRILAQQETGTWSHAIVLGRDLGSDDPSLHLELAYVSETVDFTVPYGITEFFGTYSTLFPNWDQSLFHKSCSELGLPLQQSFHQLSRGQRMQVATLAGICRRPRLLILDEITSVLDARASHYILQLLQTLIAKGSTVLMATNIVREIGPFATDVILVQEGRVVLNSGLREVSEGFVRLRRRMGDEHSIFSHPACTSVGVNPDNSFSYILPKKVPELSGTPEHLFDPRPATAEEAFLHFMGNAK